MRINEAQANAARSQASGQSNETPDQLGKEEFLRLLTTQLSQQDPLNPMDNQAFVTQLSQLASVERLENLSASIDTMTMSQSANTSAQVVSFIGQNLRVQTDQVQLAAGETDPFGFELEGDASTVDVVIRDEDGEAVRTLNLGSRNAGSHEIAWDGLDDDGNPVEDGSYTFEVMANDESGEQVASGQWAERQVEGVTFEDGFPRLLLAGGGDAALGDVMEVHGG